MRDVVDDVHVDSLHGCREHGHGEVVCVGQQPELRADADCLEGRELQILRSSFIFCSISKEYSLALLSRLPGMPRRSLLPPTYSSGVLRPPEPDTEANSDKGAGELTPSLLV